MGSKATLRIGKYFLGKRGNSAVWCACWFDNAARQTTRRSLGTTDVREAEIALARFVTREGEMREHRPDELPVATALERYWHRHGKALPSEETVRIASALLVEHFQTALVAELSIKAQERFVTAMREAGRSGGYISRILSVLRAALNNCHKHGELTAAPFVMDVEKGPARERVLSVAELARLWDAAEEEYLRWFIVLALNTAARPDAILDLTRFQIDFNHRLINLNPKGRKQTKKYRPTVPMTNTLAAWLATATGDHLVAYRGRRLQSIKSAWRRLRAKAGFGDEVIPYTLRHTIATELRARDVPEWECAGFLGHASGKTIEIYAKFRPDYLGKAARAIDDLMSEIDQCLQHRSTSISKPVRARCVSVPLREGSEPLDIMVGGTGFEPVTPTMSTYRTRKKTTR